jgi:hypothetical protein
MSRFQVVAGRPVQIGARYDGPRWGEQQHSLRRLPPGPPLMQDRSRPLRARFLERLRRLREAAL